MASSLRRLLLTCCPMPVCLWAPVPICPFSSVCLDLYAPLPECSLPQAWQEGTCFTHTHTHTHARARGCACTGSDLPHPLGQGGLSGSLWWLSCTHQPWPPARPSPSPAGTGLQPVCKRVGRGHGKLYTCVFVCVRVCTHACARMCVLAAYIIK